MEVENNYTANWYFYGKILPLILIIYNCSMYMKDFLNFFLFLEGVMSPTILKLYIILYSVSILPQFIYLVFCNFLITIFNDSENIRNYLILKIIFIVITLIGLFTINPITKIEFSLIILVTSFQNASLFLIGVYGGLLTEFLMLRSIIHFFCETSNPYQEKILKIAKKMRWGLIGPLIPGGGIIFHLYTSGLKEITKILGDAQKYKNSFIRKKKINAEISTKEKNRQVEEFDGTCFNNEDVAMKGMNTNNNHQTHTKPNNDGWN